MSYNFFFNTIDKTKEKPIEKIQIDLKNIKKILKNKKKFTENVNKKNNFLRYKQNIIDLEKSCEDSLILINMLEKHKEKTILEKYNIKNISSFKKKSIDVVHKSSNNNIENILMKKKFLKIPIKIS